MSYHHNFSSNEEVDTNNEPSIPIPQSIYAPAQSMIVMPPNHHQLFYQSMFHFHPPPNYPHNPYAPPLHYSHAPPMVPSLTPIMASPTISPVPPVPSSSSGVMTSETQDYTTSEQQSSREDDDQVERAEESEEDMRMRSSSEDHHPSSEPYNSSSYHQSIKGTTVHRCTQLTLQQKIEVLQMIDQKIPYREIAKQYNIAHSTISGIKKTKQEIYQLVQKRANLSMHRIHKSMPITSKLLDERMYSWYSTSKNQNININGKQLQQKALEIAKELNLPDFKASNGWLDSFKRRHQILLKQHSEG